MKAAIITVAGISSRFNEGIEEEKRQLKAVYFEGNSKNSLLSHLLDRCDYADRIFIVGGFKFDELTDYINTFVKKELQNKVTLIFNEYYEEFGSGYSLYLGLKNAFLLDHIEEILFVEGDLDIDPESFQRVIHGNASVLTYNTEPIYASKAVVLYRDNKGNYHYAFNSSHGFLTINEDFSVLLNSGQLWKFREIDILKNASESFFKRNKGGTNLEIIQEYLDHIEQGEIQIIGLKQWTNCNTRDDYRRIKERWDRDSEGIAGEITDR